MHFLLAFLFISVRIALAIEGSFDPVHETVCEYQDANITWHNTTTNSAHNVKSRLWYKGRTTLMARWLKGYGFEEFPPYIDRLMQIGPSGIKIREANRSDSGTYLLIWKLEDAGNTSESTSNLQVIVPPTTQCIPNITHEGDTLWAILPLEGCGIPRLTPHWTNGTQKLISDNISVLDLKSGSKLEVYIACAVGNSTRCMQVDSSNLCTNYTELQPHNESDTGLNLWWIPVLIIIIFIIIIIIVTVAGWFYWKTKKKKDLVFGRTVEEPNEETLLMNPPTTGTITSQTDDEAVIEDSLIHPPTAGTIPSQTDDEAVVEDPLIHPPTAGTITSQTDDDADVEAPLIHPPTAGTITSQADDETVAEAPLINPPTAGTITSQADDETVAEAPLINPPTAGTITSQADDETVAEAPLINPPTAGTITSQADDETVAEAPPTAGTITSQADDETVAEAPPTAGTITSQADDETVAEAPPTAGTITSQADDETVAEAPPTADIIKLRDDLIKAYRPLRCVQVSPIFEKRRCDIDTIYVDLVIGKKQDSSNTEKEKECNDPPVINSYKQIFLRETGSKFKRVFLRGKGGLGKTTFCRKVLHAWCNAHEVKAVAQDGPFRDETVLNMFHLLFYLHLREITVEEKTLIDVICKQYPLEEVPSESILKTLLKDNGDKVLFILDGLDEMIVKAGFIENIVKRKLYPNCCFLVSSRPWKISHMELDEGPEIDLLLDLRGFSKQNAIKCAEKLFEICYKDGKAIEQFTKDIAVNELAKQLIHVPLLLLYLAQVWYENKRSLPSKLHELYIWFLNLMADRMTEKYKKDPTDKQKRFSLVHTQSLLPSKISETSLVVNFGEGFLLSLCEVAHDFLLSSEKENSLVFEKTKLTKALGIRGDEKLDLALHLGILSVTDSVSYLVETNSVNFLHKTMQEFFTALYFIFKPDKLADFISSIADLSDVLNNENTIIFLVGLMPKLGNSVLVKVNELYSDEMLRIGRAQKGYSNIIPYFRLYHVNTVYLRCKEEVIGEDVLLNVSHLCLGIYDFDLHTFSSAYLQSLDLMGFSFPCNGDYVLDLRGLTGLSYFRLQSSNCELILPKSGSLSVIFMESVTLSSGCCDVLGSTLTHCTKLETLKIHKTDLHNCLLDLSNMTELTGLYMNKVTLSSSCCDVLGRTLTQCTKLETLKIHKTDLHNCLLDLSNTTELRILDMNEVTLSISCCDVLVSTLQHCTKLKTLKIHKRDLHNCLLDLSNMTELRILDMNEVTLSSSCCDVLGRKLTHCTKLETLEIHKTDLHKCLLYLSNMTELTGLDMNEVTLSSSCCDVLGRTLTHCTKLETLKIHKTDLHNCLFDFSNMTKLKILNMNKVTLSSSCCDVLGRTLTQCAKLETLKIHKTDLHNCLLDLSNMTELRILNMNEVTLSSSCCDVLGRTLSHCTTLIMLEIWKTDLHNCQLDLSNMTKLIIINILEVILSSSACQVLELSLDKLKAVKEIFSMYTFEKSPCDNDKWKVKLV